MGLWSKIRGDVFGSLAGGLIGSVFGGNSAKKQAALQRQNWAYQQQNAHQFEVGDLKAAGLNPILSATNSQIAGMGSAPSTSDNGFGAGVTNSITAALTRQANVEIEKTKADIALKEAQTNAANARTNAISAGIYGNDTSKASERFGAETANIKADTALKTSSKNVADAQYTLTTNQAKQVLADIDNSKRLTDAQIARIHTQQAVDMATVNLLAQQAQEAIARTDLTKEQKKAIKADLDSYVTKLANLTAKQRYEVLLAGTKGENATGVLNKGGFIIDLLNPFGSFGTSIGGFRVGSHK